MTAPTSPAIEALERLYIKARLTEARKDHSIGQYFFAEQDDQTVREYIANLEVERDFFRKNLELADAHAKEVLRPEIKRLRAELEAARKAFDELLAVYRAKDTAGIDVMAQIAIDALADLSAPTGVKTGGEG